MPFSTETKYLLALGVDTGMSAKDVDDVTESMFRTGEAADQVAAKTSAASSSSRSYAGSAKDANSAAKAASTSTGQFASSAARLDQSLGKMLKTAGAVVATWLTMSTATSAVVEAVDIFTDVETALVAVAKTTGITGGELRALEDDVTRLSSTSVPELTTDLLGLGAAAGQLGVEGAENILSYIETIGKLGAASDLHGENAAKVLTRILNVQGEGPEQIERLASVIVRLGNESAASESEIAKITNEVSLATASFRIGSTQASAYGAALAEIGVQAQLGGSVIGKTMRSIQDAVSSGGADLEGFADVAGLSAERFSDAWRSDPVTALNAFLIGLSSVGEDAGTFLEELGLGGEEVAKVLPPLAANFERLAEKQRLAADESERLTALSNEAAAAFGTTQKDLDRLNNAYSALSKEVGRGAAPAIREVSIELRDLVTEGQSAAFEIGQGLGEAIRAASTILVVFAENIDLAKSALGAFILLKAAGWATAFSISVGSAAAALVAYTTSATSATTATASLGATVTTTTPAIQVYATSWSAATAAQSTATATSTKFLSAGITPLSIGLASLLGGVLLVNDAISDWSDSMDREISEIQRSSQSFFDSVQAIKNASEELLDLANQEAEVRRRLLSAGLSPEDERAAAVRAQVAADFQRRRVDLLIQQESAAEDAAQSERSLRRQLDATIATIPELERSYERAQQAFSAQPGFLSRRNVEDAFEALSSARTRVEDLTRSWNEARIKGAELEKTTSDLRAATEGYRPAAAGAADETSEWSEAMKELTATRDGWVLLGDIIERTGLSMQDATVVADALASGMEAIDAQRLAAEIAEARDRASELDAEFSALRDRSEELEETITDLNDEIERLTVLGPIEIRFEVDDSALDSIPTFNPDDPAFEQVTADAVRRMDREHQEAARRAQEHWSETFQRIGQEGVEMFAQLQAAGVGTWEALAKTLEEMLGASIREAFSAGMEETVEIFADGVAEMIVTGEGSFDDLWDAVEDAWKQVLAEMISNWIAALAEMLAQWLATKATMEAADVAIGGGGGGAGGFGSFAQLFGGGGGGGGSALAGLGAYSAIGIGVVAALYFIDKYWDRKRGERFNIRGVTVGVQGGQFQGSSLIDERVVSRADQDRLINTFKEIFDAIEAQAGGVIEYLPQIGLQLRKDGEEWRVQIAGLMDETFSSLEEALEFAISNAISMADFSGVGEAVEAVLKTASQRSLEETERLLGLARRVDAVVSGRSMDLFSDQLDRFERQLLDDANALVRAGVAYQDTLKWREHEIELLRLQQTQEGAQGAVDLLDSVLRYVGDAQLAQDLLNAKAQLEIANLRLQLEAQRHLGFLTELQIARIGAAIDQIEAGFASGQLVPGVFRPTSIPNVGRDDRETRLETFLEALEEARRDLLPEMAARLADLNDRFAEMAQQARELQQAEQEIYDLRQEALLQLQQERVFDPLREFLPDDRIIGGTGNLSELELGAATIRDRYRQLFADAQLISEQLGETIAGTLQLILEAQDEELRRFAEGVVDGLGLPMEETRDRARLLGDQIQVLSDMARDSSFSMQRLQQVLAELGQQAEQELLGIAAGILDTIGAEEQAADIRRQLEEANFHLERARLNFLFQEYLALGLISEQVALQLQEVLEFVNDPENWPDFTAPPRPVTPVVSTPTDQGPSERDLFLQRLRDQIEAWSNLQFGPLTREAIGLTSVLNDLVAEADRLNVSTTELMQAWRFVVDDFVDRALDPYEGSGSPLQDELDQIEDHFDDMRAAFLEMGATTEQMLRLEQARLTAIEQAMERATAGLRSLLDDLLGSDPRLSPEQRFLDAQAQFRELADAAASGDLAALEDLEGAARLYLEQIDAFLGEGVGTLALRDEITSTIRQLLGIESPGSAGTSSSGAVEQLPVKIDKTNLILGQIRDSITGGASSLPNSIAARVPRPAGGDGAAARPISGSGSANVPSSFQTEVIRPPVSTQRPPTQGERESILALMGEMKAKAEQDRERQDAMLSLLAAIAESSAQGTKAGQAAATLLKRGRREPFR